MSKKQKAAGPDVQLIVIIGFALVVIVGIFLYLG